jgi:hypothetical protein
MSRLRITWTPSVVGPELGARVIEPKVDHLILSRQHRLNGRHRRVHDVGYSDQLLFQLDRPELHVDQVNEVGELLAQRVQPVNASAHDTHEALEGETV